MEYPLISVIVPVYNVEKYLKRCVDSILAQTYSRMEIVLVNDGSTDNSGEICEEYAKKYDNVSYVYKKNGGLGSARNAGLDLVQGKYVYFFDSDDYIREDEIERLFNRIQRDGSDVCYTGFIAVSNDEEFLYERLYDDCIYRDEAVVKELMTRMVGSSPKGKDSIEMSASAQMYSLDIIKGKGVRFVSENEFVSEDLIFNMDFLENASCASVISGAGNYYRTNPLSLSHSYRSDRFEKSKFLYTYILERLKKNGIDENGLNRAKKSFFISIRMSIKQEVEYGKDLSRDEIKKRLRNICGDPVVRKTIKEYPVNELGFKQSVFLFLVKKNAVGLLMLLTSHMK